LFRLGFFGGSGTQAVLRHPFSVEEATLQHKNVEAGRSGVVLQDSLRSPFCTVRVHGAVAAGTERG